VDDGNDEDPLVMVYEFATEEGARKVGAELVERGIGAEVEPVPAAELDDDGPRAAYRVLVLEHQLVRAQEVLGLVEPEDRPPANPEEPMEPVKGETNWKAVVLIWLAALILLPAVAFFVTYTIMSR
jgi:hypothetical protein